MSFDNVHIQIRGEHKDDLLTAIQLAMKITDNSKVVSYKIDDKYGFIVNWVYNDGESHPLPVALGPEEITGIIWKWLESLDWSKVDSQYDIVSFNGRLNDYDVVEERGWLLYTEEWGHVNGQYSAIFAVVPAWLWLGK
jgi:hypothetical protein